MFYKKRISFQYFYPVIFLFLITAIISCKNDLCLVFSAPVDYISRFINEASSYLIKHEVLAEEIVNLKNELNELKNKKFESFEFPTERLRVYYTLDNGYNRSVICSRYEQKIKAPIVDNNGFLVGLIIRHGFYNSKARLINDVQSKIPVYIGENNFEGLLCGCSRFGLVIKRLKESKAVVKAGDIIKTSGVCGIFPKDIPVATIESIKKGKIIAKPLWKDLNYVYAIHID